MNSCPHHPDRGGPGPASVSGSVRTAHRLTERDVRDGARLAEAVYAMLEGQRGRRTRSARIRKLQRELRKLVDHRAWSTYLSLEEAVNGRADRELMLVAAWAFREGRRSAR